MENFDPLSSFGPDVAARYDDELRGDEDDTVAFLASLADGRPACELAVGTGRIALPLAAAGVEVCGIDQSRAMLDRLRARPGGERVRVVRGDMASEAPEGTFGLVYLVFNTIGNVLTQQGQVDVFRNAASRLDDDGVFVVENAVPWQTFGRTQFVEAERVTGDEVVLDVNRFDPTTQLLSENHVTLSADGVRMGPIAQRLTTPAELDLMARVAGLTLRERYGGWRREPFTPASPLHVSVWGR
ncbi:class I SAM-dependent DNA methyltransferase [Nocardioides sp. GXQ0305]|uniref:class I SAM-dependent DNA methyltransferase n=1 Tax=Nocardioides sp. GXQ0305 TaxID=3423912 RepID=UPI003D7CAD0C